MGKDTRKDINVMDFNEYQKRAVATAIYRDEVDKLVPAEQFPEANKALRIAYSGLGLGEAGEVQNKLKKIIRDSGGKITDKARVDIVKELGGVLWYVAACADELGVDLHEVAMLNIAQLRDRASRNVLKGAGDDR
jgi:NTP pyrophosphatase (non-canonical NTP hydrolase)